MINSVIKNKAERDVSGDGDDIALLLNRHTDNLGAAIAANPLLNVTLGSYH